MGNEDLFGGTYIGKTVFITGHSGFGGVWLSAWLSLLGANVVGYSNQMIVERNKVNLSELVGNIKEVKGDIRQKIALERAIRDSQPDIVFHLAAQPLVIPSYVNPHLTFETNVLGTTNLLEAIRNSRLPIAVVFITSDKVYKNGEARRGYIENDNLGGYDPYSASKAMSELAINSYLQSSTEPGFAATPLNVASARSGNWIGGGDFSEYRLIPDLVKALGDEKVAILRNPNSIRPWQFVLDALKGFLILGSNLLSNESKFLGAWNFGPSDDKLYTCEELFKLFVGEWGSGNFRKATGTKTFHETKVLTLNSQKAFQRLGWEPTYSIIDTIKQTVDWYKLYFKFYSELSKKNDMTSVYFEQIYRFTNQSKTINI